MNKVTKTLLVSSITNIFLSIIKLVFGFIGKCSTLLADGVHSFSDLSTDLIAIFGNLLSLKPADKEHPFGHGKIEYITSMMIGLVVLILGFTLIYNAFDKEIVIPNILIILVSIFTIFSKYILASFIYKRGIKYKNNILIASGKESRADVYSSIFVLISIVLMQFSNKIEFLKYADMVGTIIIALFIVKTGYFILKDNISVLLEKQIDDVKYIDKIKKIILSFEQIINIDSLYILRYGPYYKLISNVIMEEKISLQEAHQIIDELETKIKNQDEKIRYVFIHMEPKEKF